MTMEQASVMGTRAKEPRRRHFARTNLQQRRTSALLPRASVPWKRRFMIVAMILLALLWINCLQRATTTVYLAICSGGKCGQSYRSSVQPYDLRVNHLAGLTNFLPIVSPNNQIRFRFRLRSLPGAPPSALRDIIAIQVIARHAYNSQKVLWDSGKIGGTERHDIRWAGEAPPAGAIVEWRVSVWDGLNRGPTISPWSKFAVGPDQWIGQWIAHPADVDSFHLVANETAEARCEQWKARRPLPTARSELLMTPEDVDNIESALLVVSGLGAFHVSMNNESLSEAPLDPPLMDYTQRVSYRGFDITRALQTKDKLAHTFQIHLGSSWWDARPLEGGIVKFWLLPRGPSTAVAELHLRFQNDTQVVKMPTSNDGAWKMTKGNILDSDLFTGDTIELGVAPRASSWVEPVLYRSSITTTEWRRRLTKRAVERDTNVDLQSIMAPIGKLVPSEMPPVMAMEKVEPESIVHLGDGRWLYDFGKAFSGVLRFETGLPDSVVPSEYPRGHQTNIEQPHITVVYGESLQIETGDINQVLVAGMGLHDGGPSKPVERRDTPKRGGPCYPRDHGEVLAQRDVFVGDLRQARQAKFTTHSFRFAEVCCTQFPPEQTKALLYRTAVPEWGSFDSSHVLLNGAYELTRNALVSNLLGVQSDCPHREKLPYGGDINANAPSSMHFFDISSFYRKVIHDWTDSQWDNGAYTETSVWQDLNDQYTGVGQGSGETVWASLPPVLTVRHFQHYGDKDLIAETFANHVRWLEFLWANWDGAMVDKYGGNEDFDKFFQGGFGDWLSIFPQDCWLTHHAYYMASARSVAYLKHQLRRVSGVTDAEKGATAFTLAEKIRSKIVKLYMNGTDVFQPNGRRDTTPRSELALFSRVVPGPSRCAVLRDLVQTAGDGRDEGWPGDEEDRFLRHLNQHEYELMIERGDAISFEGDNGTEPRMLWRFKKRFSMGEGIFAVRYKLKALSDNGFHNIALSKATGEGFGTFEYMLSHNATTLWESWWRSEDSYSRNHPMLGAVAEWLVSSVAGVSLDPTTVGGRDILFWPRIPMFVQAKRALDSEQLAGVTYASATQGTLYGEASIAWRFELEQGSMKAARSTNVRIRLLVPPGSQATLRLQRSDPNNLIVIREAKRMPDLGRAKMEASTACAMRRKRGLGFTYNWEYNREDETWHKRNIGKAIGTPCEPYLFHESLGDTAWEYGVTINGHEEIVEVPVHPGLHEVHISKWQLRQDPEESFAYNFYNGPMGPFCSDPSTFVWDVRDATHII